MKARPGFKLPLYSRLLLVLAVALVIAAIAAEAFGARTESRFSGAVNPQGGQAVMIAVLAVTSSGLVEVEVYGGVSVYAIEIAGSPLTAINQVTSLGVNVRDQKFFYDFRSGYGYGDAVIDADPLLLEIIPQVSGNVREAVSLGEEVHLIEGELDSGQGMAIIVTLGEESEETVTYRGSFVVSDYYRLDLRGALAVSIAMAAAALILPRALDRLLTSYSWSAKNILTNGE